MKFLFKKIYIILLLFSILFTKTPALSKDNKILYTSENISNYFSGIIAVNKDYNSAAHKYLKKVRSLKKSHYNYNIEFVRTLVLLEKFDEAVVFSEKIWNENELFFEADLILGLDSFIKKDYKKSKKHFERLNRISKYNLFFDDFIGNVLLAWNESVNGNKKDSFLFLDKTPNAYQHLIRTQKSLLKCFFDSQDTKKFFEKLVQNKEYNFSRYNFFLANYLLSKNKSEEAKQVIISARKKHNSNILLQETEFFLENNKAISFFNCKDPKDSIAEFFYVLANLFSSEQEYQLSNFYIKISQLLNKNFLTNNALLAENFYYQKKYKLSNNIYKSLKSIGPTYSWYATKSISKILLKEKGKEYSISYLEKEFELIKDPSFMHYYELANFYKDNMYYEDSIKYYSLALNKINNDHLLIPKILDRRGTSYERSGDWENAEKDLIKSLEILPNQAHVLNYLAYSWIDQGINIDKGLEMLKKANEIRSEDGYIIDSLGWAYYAKKNYIEAEKFLQKAVQLLPFDPIINDHYADTLWMLNKNIQARYIWKNILELDSAEKELKDIVNKKLIFGVTNKL